MGNRQNRKGVGGAVGVLRSDGVVVFPTDTVWGVGALISSDSGVEKLYRVMRRPVEKPTAVLVDSLEMAKKYGEFDQKAEDLVKENWPGRLTVVVEANKELVPEMVRGGGETVGLRMPDHELVLELIRWFGEGLVASSANVLEGETPIRFEQIEESFLEKVDFVVKGECGERKASTVVDVSGEGVVVVRQGLVKV